ncbi:hypothetical protein Bca4012_018874 [Brassica carinata]
MPLFLLTAQIRDRYKPNSHAQCKRNRAVHSKESLGLSDLEEESWSDVEEVVDEEIVDPGGSKTLFARNLSFQVERSDIEEFFKEAGQVVDIKFDTSKYDGEGRFLGFGLVEFATAREAQKALEFRGRPLLCRQMRLEAVCLRG